MATSNKTENSKAGSPTQTPTSVKALVDSGLQKIRNIFVWPSEHQATRTSSCQLLQPPVIDLSGNRNQIVEQVLHASGTWGIFQVVNHGVPQSVLDGMIEGVRKFNEQDEAEKNKYCSKDHNKKVRFHGGFELFPTTAASWRDTLAILLVSEPNPFMYKEQIPPPLRDSSLEYSKEVDNLGDTIFGLLSEALGLETNHLKSMECGKGQRMYCHYYPACPEPDVALGLLKHSDAGFLTILLQNQISGLQVLHKDQWAVTNLVNNESISDIDRLRLVMLYALRYEKDSPVQLMQLFNKLAARSPKYKPGLVQFLLKQAGVDKRTGDLYGNRDLLNYALNMARGLKGVENVYTQHQPLLVQTMESILKGRLRDLDYPYVGKHFQQARPLEVIIFVVGGTTYEEARSVTLQNSTNSGVRFILGGSAVLNSKGFLKDLEEAKRMARTSSNMI